MALTELEEMRWGAFATALRRVGAVVAAGLLVAVVVTRIIVEVSR